MSLNFAAITPHPPIIVPEVGGEELDKVTQTAQAMKKLAFHFREAEIETLIIISPHMLIYPDRFNICGMKKLFGTFSGFGAPQMMLDFKNNLDLAAIIDHKANQEGIDSLLYDNNGEFFELDHGSMVPLSYLAGEQESSFKVLPLAYSNQSRANHFAFGQFIGEIVKNEPGRIGLAASGDLSHRLIQGTKEQIRAGKEFDMSVVNDLKESNAKKIIYYDDALVEAAGECGYRSILILLGALSNLNPKSEILSYEAPFGVGYLVANFRLGN